MAEKLNLLYKLLKAEVTKKITSELNETFDSVNKALSDTCEVALKQPIPGKQLVLFTNASFRSAGYALMVEDNPYQKLQSMSKLTRLSCSGQKSRTTKNAKLLETLLGDLYGISRVCVRLVGSIRSITSLNRQ